MSQGLARPSAVTDPVTTVCSFDGKQRNCGLELATCGDVLNGLRLMASVTFHDADGVPKRAINFGVGWDLPWVPGLSLNGRVITTSSP